MSPMMYPCRNPFCPTEGFTTIAGDLCDDCLRRQAQVGKLLDKLETNEQKQARREKRRQDNKHRKGGEE